MLPPSPLLQFFQRFTGGRNLNRAYVLALVLPLLIIVLFSALRNPFLRNVDQAIRFSFSGGYEEDEFDDSENKPEIKVADLQGSPEEKGWQVVNRRHTGLGAPPPQYYETNPNANLPGPDSERLKRMKELLGSHPNNVTLLTMHLKMMDGYDGRVAGPWEVSWAAPEFSYDPYSYEPLSRYPYDRTRTATLTDAEINDGLEVAARGRKLEPQNTFFDWMSAFLLFAKHSDEEAIRTLIAASRKSEFNLHWRETLKAAFNNPGLNSIPLAEDQLDLVVMASRDYNCGMILHAARQALWFAMQQDERGNAKRALEIEGASVRLGHVIQTQGFFNDDRVQGALLMKEAWAAPKTIKDAKNFFRKARTNHANVSNNSNPPGSSAPMPIPGGPVPGGPLPPVNDFPVLQQNFKKYCLVMGRPDLARETVEISKSPLAPIGSNEINSGNLTTYQLNDFLRPPAREKVSYASSVLDYLFQGTVSIVCLWFFFVLLGPWRMPKGEVAPIVAADFRWPLGVSLPLVSLTSLVGFHAYLGNAKALTSFLFGYSSPWELYDLARNGVAIIPLLCCAFYCIFATRQHLTRLPTPEPTRLNDPTTLGASAEVEMLHRVFWRSVCLFWFRVLPIALMLAWTCLSVTFIDWGFIGGAHNHWGYPTPWFVIYGRDLRVMCLLALLPIVFTLFIRWRFAMPKFQRATIYGGFLGFRRLLAWCIPLNLWLMLVCLIIGAQARFEVEADLLSFLNVEKSVTAEAHRLWPNSSETELE